MPNYPQLPDNAPFSPEQKAWLNGWIAGVLSSSQLDLGTSSTAAPAAAPKPLTILFGSQTGTAEGLAKKLSKEAQGRGFVPQVLGMEQYAKAGLDKCERLLVITSTYGDGDPPDNAATFWQWLSADGAPGLAHMQYSVLALGDTNYEKFCAFGKAVDERLLALGATRASDRVDSDTDYDAPFASWAKAALEKLSAGSSTETAGAAVVVTETVVAEAPAAAPGTKANPFQATLKTNHLLTTATAAKETRHFEIDINGLNYEVGDALGVLPTNNLELVDALMVAGQWTGDDALRNTLQTRLDLTNPSRDLLQAVAERSKNEDLIALLKPERSADLKAWLYGRDVMDVLQLCKAGEFSSADFTALLKKLQPRLYSIASSIKANPGHVHLTIAQVRYESYGRKRGGVCSTFLADRASSDTPVPVFVQPSHGFRLPSDDSRPVIMVGPGTGVAPFRAFLQERHTTGAKGKNWLFFGEQSRAQSYFYKDEWADLIKAGTLTRLDTAFSRDQEQKIYVQHRMAENGAELYRWLEEGGHFYVCGDASRMAKDVDNALHQIIETHGGKSADEAKAYVNQLKESKRYARDVY